MGKLFSVFFNTASPLRLLFALLLPPLFFALAGGFSWLPKLIQLQRMKRGFQRDASSEQILHRSIIMLAVYCCPFFRPHKRLARTIV